MSLPLASALDLKGTLSRLPSSVESNADWGGDQSDEYATVKTGIPCRLETTDIDEHLVWIMDDGVSPEWGDRFLIQDLNLQLDVIRVRRWTRASGKFHHYELRCKEISTLRRLTDDG